MKRRSQSSPPIKVRPPVNRPAAKKRNSFRLRIGRGYRLCISSLDTFEKSPIVRLFVAFVFLITAAAVLIELNDRNTLIEIAGWDLFENTEPGTQQRTRALQILSNVGAKMSEVYLSTKDEKADIRLLLSEVRSGTWANSLLARDSWCNEGFGMIKDSSFAPKQIWSSVPPFRRTNYLHFERAVFNCLAIINSSFAETRLTEANFVATIINRTDFSSAEMRGTRFDAANIGAVTNFSNANLGNSSFEFTFIIEANFRGSNLKRSSFEGATIVASDFRDANLEDVNVSKSNFIDTTGLQPHLEKFWAWEDRPPVGELLGKVFLCSADLREKRKLSVFRNKNYDPLSLLYVPERCSYKARMNARQSD